MHGKLTSLTSDNIIHFACYKLFFFFLQAFFFYTVMSLSGFGIKLRWNSVCLELFPFSAYWKNMHEIGVISLLNV